MATETRLPRIDPGTTLRGITWKTYLRLRSNERNFHVRMSYLDGTLIFMSPAFIHDRYGRRLGLVVDNVTEALDIPTQGIATTTLRLPGDGPRKGTGKEADNGFYFRENEPRMRTKDDLVLPDDPPPDLAIEVDHKADSKQALQLYARLGVPELWVYRVRRRLVQFLRLAGEGYEPIDRSLSLPRLTPALVTLALEQAEHLGETAWKPWLREWARGLPDPPA